VTLDELAKYSVARSIARPLCDSWLVPNLKTRFFLSAYPPIRDLRSNAPIDSLSDFGSRLV